MCLGKIMTQSWMTLRFVCDYLDMCTLCVVCSYRSLFSLDSYKYKWASVIWKLMRDVYIYDLLKGWYPSVTCRRTLNKIKIFEKLSLCLFSYSIDCLCQMILSKYSVLSFGMWQTFVKTCACIIETNWHVKKRLKVEIFLPWLQKEKAEHGQTRGKLMDVTDKLEFALGQIEVLTKQLEREKTAFENA